MRYVVRAVAVGVVMALAACKPSPDSGAARGTLPVPSPVIPHAPSAPVVPPDPPEPEPRRPPAKGAHQTLIFMGPMDLTIRLSTQDNFATAVMTDNFDRTLEMHRVPSSRGVRLENDEGVAIQFRNGEGSVEFASGDAIDIVQYRLP